MSAILVAVDGPQAGDWLAALRDNAKTREVLAWPLRSDDISRVTFACVWHLLSSDQARTAVEVAELHADGLAGDEELEEAQEAAAKLPSLSGVVAKWASSCVAHSGAMLVVDAAGQLAASPPDQEYDPARWTAETAARQATEAPEATTGETAPATGDRARTRPRGTGHLIDPPRDG